MERLRLIITATARADLRNIRKHIAKDSPATARAFIEDLTIKLYSLAELGITGSPRNNIKLGLRGFPYRGRCFYFYIVDKQMFLVRVLHNKQDRTIQDFPYKN